MLPLKPEAEDLKVQFYLEQRYKPLLTTPAHSPARLASIQSSEHKGSARGRAA